MEDQIQRFQKAFNQDKDYITCHHISRDMLLQGDQRSLAKTLATLSALAEQVNKERLAGYHKLYQKLLNQLAEIDTFPFDEVSLRHQLSDLNDQIERGEVIREIPLQLKR